MMVEECCRYLQGDCREILKTIPDRSVDLLITDPPYGIIKNKNVAVKGLLNAHKIKKNDCEWDQIDDLISFSKEWWNAVCPKMKDNTFAFIFWSQKFLKEGFEIFDFDRLIFWRYKNFILGGNGSFAYDYDPIFVVHFGKPKLSKGMHSCDLEFTKPQSNFKYDKSVHPTQKPLDLITHLIEISSSPNALVLDIFGGSGTTGLAAWLSHRRAVVIEKNETYYETALTRWNDRNVIKSLREQKLDKIKVKERIDTPIMTL